MSSTVVITGAARGIGAAIAKRFVDDGWNAILVDVSREVEAAARLLQGGRPGRAEAVVADITTDDGIGAIQRAVDGAAPLRTLVNNAGITRDAMLHKMTDAQLRSALRVNLGAAIRLTTELVPLMDDGSSVVSLSSRSANGNIGQFNYAVSKAGLVGMTRSLALELSPRVRVNAVAPAFIGTAMTDAIPDELRSKSVARIPFMRPGEPAEVADCVAWLASPQASYVTGQVVAICGGRSFGP